MKRPILAAAMLLNLVAFAQSPTFLWAQKLGGTSTDEGNAVTVDGANNVIVTGAFSGTVDFDPGAGVVNLVSSGATDIFVAKYTTAGALVWAKQMGGTSSEAGNSLVTDASGNIYVSGYFNGTSDFDPGAGVSNLASGFTDNGFIVKLTSAGNFSWVKQIGSSSGACYPLKLQIDNTGNLYTCGYFNGTTDLDPGAATYNLNSTNAFTTDGFILKLDANGSFVWAGQVGGTGNDYTYGVSVSPSGDVITSGFYENTADLNPESSVNNFTSNGLNDIFVTCVNNAGNFNWAFSVGGTGNDISRDLTTDQMGSTYISGNFSGTADFNPGPSTNNLTSSGIDAFVLKIDAMGNYVWAKSFGGSGSDAVYRITTDGAGYVHTIGTFNGTADFDPNAGVSNLTSGGAADIFISKLNGNGNFVWAQNFGGSGNDNGNSIFIDGSGNIYSAGTFNSSGDFDPGAGTTILTPNGISDAFMHKLNQCSVPDAPVNTTPLANLSICSNGSTTLSAIGWGTQLWYTTPSAGIPISFGPSLNLTSLSAGTYTYYVEANTCQSSAARTAITITVNPNPVLTVTDGTICAGDAFTISPSGANTYTYSGGSNVVSPVSNTSYTVTGTGANGCQNLSGVVCNVVVNSLPVLGVSNGTICAGESFTINPSGASTYTYSGGGSIVSPGTTSTYTVTGTNSNGCSNTVGVVCTVNVNNLPVLSVTDGTICTGESFTMMPSGANTYTFSNGTNVVNPTSTSFYTVTGTGLNGCTDNTGIVCTVNVNSIPLLSVTDGTICAGQFFTMVPSGASTYTYSGGSNIVNPTSTNVYTITGTSAAGCTNTTGVVCTVNVNALPVLSVSDGTICPGQSYTLSPSGALTYTYSSGGSVVSPLSTTSYTISGTDSQGCIGMDVVATVSVQAGASITVGGPNVICSGQSATLVAMGATSYTWSTGANTNSIVVNPSSSSSYTVEGDNGGCAGTTTHSMQVNSLPVVNVISTSSTICAGQTATLTASGATSYTWSNGANTSSIIINPSSTSSYTVDGEAGGCYSNSVYSVQVNSLPVLNIVSTPSMICAGQNGTLSVSGASTYTWNGGATTPSLLINLTTSTNYTVTGEDSLGCVNTATFVANVSPCLGIKNVQGNSTTVTLFPNPASDYLRITSTEENKTYTISLFNSLGQLVLTEEFLSGERINIQQLPEGLYTVKIFTENKLIATEKLIKN